MRDKVLGKSQCMAKCNKLGDDTVSGVSGSGTNL